jgi:hypothetical protein
MLTSILFSLALLVDPGALSGSHDLSTYGKILTDAEAAAYFAADERRSVPLQTRAVAFPARTYRQLLSQPGAVGIVAEYAIVPESGRETLLLRAVDDNNRAFGEWLDHGGLIPPDPIPLDALERAGVALGLEEVEAYHAAAQARTAREGAWANTFSAALPAWVYRHLLAQEGAIGIANYLVIDPKTGRDTLLLRAVGGDGRPFGAYANFTSPCPSACDEAS